MKNSIIENLEEILKDRESTPQERTLAVCILEIKNKVIYIEKLSKIQIALLSSIIVGLITLAVSVK